MPSDELDWITPTICVMPHIETNTQPLVPLAQESLDLHFVFNVCLSMRMKYRAQVVTFCDVSDPRSRLEQPVPGSGRQFGIVSEHTGEQVGVDIVDQQQVTAAQLH